MLNDFGINYAPARKSIQHWLGIVQQARWASIADMKMTFPSADYVAPNVVFNVGGKKYRIVTLINFDLKIVQIERVFTHEQYDKWMPKAKKRK